MSDGLILSKLKISPYRNDTVRRDKLDLRQTILSHRITIVSAAAGYGKSTLLSQWQKSLSECGFSNVTVNLDRDDNDPILFMKYLITGINTTLPDCGDSALNQISAGGKISVKTVLRSLIHDIESINTPFVIFFDDYHHIHAQAVHDLLEWLFSYLPSFVKVVIASRSCPSLSTIKLKLSNEYCDLNSLDLQFNYEEIKTFFNYCNNMDLNEYEIKAIYERTEGWITGIRLAYLAMQEIDNRELFIKEFSGTDRDIKDYLETTVFLKQSDTIKDFLLKTSILNYICADNCRVITGRDDCQQLLKQIEQANLFLVSLDRNGESYRYHQLFQNFLQRKLKKEQPHLAQSLHLKASQFFLDKGLETEAVNHGFLSEDLEYTAELITNFTKKYLGQFGQVKTVVNWVQRLPDEILNTRPAIRIAYIRCLTLTCQYEKALVELTQLQSYCVKIENDTSISLERLNKLKFSVVILQARLFAFMDNTHDLRSYCEEALEKWPDGSPFDIAAIYSSLAYSCLISFEFEDGLKIANKGRAISQRCDAYLSLSWQHLISGIILFHQGDLREAEYHFRQATEINVSFLGYQSEMHCTVSTCLAATLYEQNRLEESEEVLNVDFMDNDFVNVETMVLGYRTLARLKMYHGEDNDALDLLRQGESVGYKFNLPRLALHMAAEQVFYYLRLRNTEKAIRTAKQKGFFDPINNLCGTDDREIMTEIQKLVQIKIAIARANTIKEKPILNELIEHAKKHGRVYYLIQLLTLKAEIEWQDNNKNEAVNQLDMAIDLAAPGGFYRIFFDNCPIIQIILEKKIKDCKKILKEANDSISKDFIIVLAKHFFKNISNEIFGASKKSAHNLTSREIQIIKCLESGESNSGISDILFISEGTVKWHLHNIYKKLGTKNRSGTISLARKLELI